MRMARASSSRINHSRARQASPAVPNHPIVSWYLNTPPICPGEGNGRLATSSSRMARRSAAPATLLPARHRTAAASWLAALGVGQRRWASLVDMTSAVTPRTNSSHKSWF